MARVLRFKIRPSALFHIVLEYAESVRDVTEYTYPLHRRLLWLDEPY